MRVVELSYSSFNGREKSCSRFPGVALAGDELVMLFDDGVNCDSPYHDMRVALSADGGKNWTDGGIMYDAADLHLPHLFTENCKPAAMDNGEMISVGFGFERDEPELGLSAYAQKYGHFPKSHNTVSRSIDGGRTWSVPKFMNLPVTTALELSGPVLWCSDAGKLLAFGPPFVLRGEVQRGLAAVSGDRGNSWEINSEFFKSDHIAPWETRVLRDHNGRIWLVFWAYDFATQTHLNNHVVYSDDLGKTWSVPLDTGIRGQAANLFEWRNQLWICYTRREGNNPGILCAPLTLTSKDQIASGESVALWLAAGMSTPEGRIERQFHDLKFGQPSLTPLPDGNWLLIYWSCENQLYSIRSRILRFE